MRISEVCTLKGDAYYWDGEDAWLKVYQIKMKADKMIPIPLVMYRIMRKYIEREHIRPKDYIFKGKDGGAYRGTTFRQEFQQYCDKNGIADGSYIFKTHDYRHTLATQFYDEDVSIQTIRDYLGHFSEEMTKQYVDFMPKRIEKASDTYFKKPENDLASTIKAKKRGERKCKKRIYIYELDCYKVASEEQIQRMRISPERYFNLEGLPSEELAEKLEEFIWERGKMLAPSSMASEVTYYNNIREFLIDRKIQSLDAREEEKIIRMLKGWMLERGYALSSKKYRPAYDKIGIESPGIVRHMKKILKFLEEEDDRDEQEKDIWTLKNFDFPIYGNPIKNTETINFTKIVQPDIREEVKKVIFMHLKYSPFRNDS